jgi:hypothetical protein
MHLGAKAMTAPAEYDPALQNELKGSLATSEGL